jgi:putative peptidoglycan lipid II flippase
MKSAAFAHKETAAIVFNIFLITIPFSAGISMLSALLQTMYEFKYPAISILFLNISVIIMLILFTDRFGIFVIPFGYLVGTVVQFFYLIYKSRNFFKLRLFHGLKRGIVFKSFFGTSLVTILLIESIGQLYVILDRYFYTSVEPGGIASLNYAYIIFILPISIFSIPLATAVFPKITNTINTGSEKETEKIYIESISINLMLFIPITFIFFQFGESIISTAFERGKFLSDSTTGTVIALKCYSIGLIFCSAYSILNKIFYSLSMIRVLLVISILGIFIKYGFNYLLVGEFKQYGLAISTSLSFIFFFVGSFLIIVNKLRISNKSFFLRELIFHLSNSLICYFITYTITISFDLKDILYQLIMLTIFILIYFGNLVRIDHKMIGNLKQIFNKLHQRKLLTNFK